ncbi:zinc finger BED domain-containing protein DAYSLEEPER-like [Vitis riparia]|uniref:zinc finger BED domain-containing protein DAYSLEEPER-like n=1 Tax=Vitis riparia TaxID=96939 RepID=UPI00155A2BA6|nr:zinc finger BED domain-containing protein DAYSLEEPER-like [Vitis riparia]
MSKVALDSAFNMEGRVLDHDRSSLSPATVQALVCAQDWMRNELEDSKSFSSHSTLPLCVDTSQQVNVISGSRWGGYMVLGLKA